MHRVPLVFFLETNRFREPPFWRHENLQPQEEYCIESTAGVAEPDSGSHDDNLDLGGEGGEGDEEGGRTDEEEEVEERTHTTMAKHLKRR